MSLCRPCRPVRSTLRPPSAESRGRQAGGFAAVTRDEERIRGDGRVPAPRGGPARGYLAGSIPAPGWRAPLTTSGQRAGQLDAQRDQTHPVRSDAAGARGRGLCIQGGASRTADPPSGWDDALGRGVSAPALAASVGAGGRAQHRAGGPASLVPANRPRKGGSSHCLQAQCPGPLPRRLLHPPLAPLTPHAGGHEAPHRLCGAASSPGAGRAGLAAGGPEASLVCRLRSQMGPEAGTGGDDGP